MSEPTPPISYTFEVPSYAPVFVTAPARQRPYWLHLLLLVLTIFTTLVVGARLQYNFVHELPAFTTDTFSLPLFPIRWILQSPARLAMGLPFSMTLLAILLAHEFGHFVVAERNGVYATLPYFVPAPTLIGTFGALIRIKSPIRSRKALFDIGIAGPIAGFLVALPVLLWGLALSKPMPAEATGSALEFGYPLIFHLFHHVLSPLAHNNAPLSALYLHPVGIAAWVGMFATALNLIPGRAIRWWTHHLRGRSTRAQMGHANHHRLTDSAGHFFLDGLAGLGCDSGLYRDAPSRRSAMARHRSDSAMVGRRCCRDVGPHLSPRTISWSSAVR